VDLTKPKIYVRGECHSQNNSLLEKTW
jgi:hypothetical protein